MLFGNNKIYKSLIVTVLHIIYAAGIIASIDLLSEYKVDYLILVSINITLSFLLLNKIIIKKNKIPFPLLCLLGLVYFSYLIKCITIMVFHNNILPESFVNDITYHAIKNPVVLYASYFKITLFFITITSISLFSIKKIPQIPVNNIKIVLRSNKFMIRIYLFLILIMVATFIIMYVFGIGRMGEANVELPFRISGFVFHVRIVLIPALLLLLISYNYNIKSNKGMFFTLLLMTFHGISDIFLRSSKGALLSMVLLVLIYLILDNRLTIKHIKIVATTILLTILSFPVLSEYRHVRMLSASSSNHSINLDRIIENINFQNSSLFLDGLKSMFLRFPGFDNVLHIIASSRSLELTTELHFSEITSYYTHNVLGYPITAMHSSAPSLLGWLILYFGEYYFVIGLIVFSFFILFIWRTLNKNFVFSKTVIASLFSWWVFRISSDGVLDDLGLSLAVLFASMVICEYITRKTFYREHELT